MSTELRLLTVPHKLLRTRCDESFTIPEDLIPLMFKLMREKNGLGLAAPQVGVNARLFVTYWGEVFCDPVIDNLSHPAFVNEGCLSVPDHLATVRRYLDIKVGHQTTPGCKPW
jgi:peptide deformylase